MQADPVRRLLTILLLAPVAEEGIFRLLIFGRLLSAGMGFPGAAVLSSLALDLSWKLDSGVYGFLMGMVLAWDMTPVNIISTGWQLLCMERRIWQYWLFSGKVKKGLPAPCIPDKCLKTVVKGS